MSSQLRTKINIEFSLNKYTMLVPLPTVTIRKPYAFYSTYTIYNLINSLNNLGVYHPNTKGCVHSICMYNSFSAITFYKIDFINW